MYIYVYIYTHARAHTQNKPKFNSYTETVHPQKICKGLMEIREQLQLEWVTDLPVMEEEDAFFRLAVKKLEAAEDAALDPPTEYRLGADGKSAKPVVRDKTFSTIYTST
jgi:hypothetical protein